MKNDNTDLADLVERSSLGTEAASLLRQRAPKERVESVVAAAHERRQDNPGTLVEAAADGDADAQRALLRWIRPLVSRYCRTRVGGQEGTSGLADDVAQEVCLAVLTALPSYCDEGRPFLAFVYGIASHKVADAHRSAARDHVQSVPEIPDVSELPEERRIAVTERMAKLLDRLPERQRDVVYLRVVMGLSAEETAEAVGSTPGAVRVSQHRALSRLRVLLKSDSAGPVSKGQVRPQVHPEEFEFTGREWDAELRDLVLALQLSEALARP